MSGRTYFIISLSWVDWLTLGSLSLSGLGLQAALQNMLTLAVGLMLMAMLIDMLDGLIARRMRLDSEFGKYLDGLCDVFTYLVLPLLILFQLGMRDVLSLSALFLFLIAEVLRLARFNIISTVEEHGREYHLGLPVIWSQLVVVLAFPAWAYFGERVRYLFSLLLVAMSLLMIRNVRVPKPTRYVLQAIIILSVSVIYFSLHFNEIDIP